MNTSASEAPDDPDDPAMPDEALAGLPGFAPPPFDPAAALGTLRRSLRDLKLVEREGCFEWKGLAVAAAVVQGHELNVRLARKPLRSPDWDHHTLRNHADLRRWTDDVRKRLAHWADARSDDH